MSLFSQLKNICLGPFAAKLEERRWAGGIADKNCIKVFYGRDHVPGRDEIAQGGLVKYQDLSTRFPNTLNGANIVYLVSSALPSAIVPLIKSAKKAGATVVVNQNGVAYPAWHGDGWERANEPLKFLVEAADYVVYQSEFCKKSADRFIGPCGGGWEILYNPVDTGCFVPGLPVPLSRGPVLLASGSHMQFYRVESVIRAFALVARRFESARLVIAGYLGWKSPTTAAENDVRTLCMELHVEDKVEIIGKYTQEQLVPILHSAHILVHTKYNDPCPRMVVEALACGLPVVYSDSGGTPELVGKDAGAGVPVPQGWDVLHAPGHEAIAGAVADVVGNYDVRSKAARQRAVERFDTRPWLDRHAVLFRELLSQK